MKFFETSKYFSLKKSTYISLRWIAIIGQLFSINIVYFFLKFDYNFLLSNLIVILGAISNLYLIFIYKKTQLSERSALIFLIIDVVWLSFSVKSFYRPNIGHLLLETPVMWAAILFYLIYVIGLAVVIIEPSLDFENTQKFLIKAFMFGLVAYGTYNLTNMATIKGWSPNVVFVDMIWGGSLTTFSSYFGILLAKKILL